jgi:protease-4
MRRFAGGILLGLLLAPLLCAASVYLYLTWWLSRPPTIANRSTLVLSLAGSILERPVAGRLTTVEIWQVLRHAATDSRIVRLVLLPESPVAGWAKLTEIRNAILAFRKSGKPVLASLRTPGLKDYYLASAANRICVPPSDLVDVKGLRVELLYGRGLLDRLGILPEFEAAGKYKDGADTLTRSSMSDVTREVMNELLDARMATFVDAVAAGRGRTSDEVRAWIDAGPMLAPDARKLGMVDALEFEEQILADAKRVDAQDYIRAARTAGSKVAVLSASGEIVRSTWSWLSDEPLTPEEYLPVIRSIRDDTSVRGVILRVDSPGGDAIASDELLHELKLLAAKKPVVVSMADVAASGGYALSLSGSPIVAYPETVTGSIGVFYGKLTLQGLYDKIGLRKEILTRGRFADIDSEARPLSKEARQKLRVSIEQSYRQFVGQVAQARKKGFSEIEAVAQGRIWLGAQARERGLVDELGGIERAIGILRKRASIEGAVRLELYPKGGYWQEAVAILERLAASRWQMRLPGPAMWKRMPVLSEPVE